jgi:hypothetical protein
VWAARALVLGYFTTVGDLEVLVKVEEVLTAREVRYDVAPFGADRAAALPGAVRRDEVDPSDYTHLLIVCGPFHPDFYRAMRLDLDRFAHCTRIGVNLTMLRPLDEYDPLDAVLGRDSNQWAWPDLSFAVDEATQPVAGICVVRNQFEYGSRADHDRAAARLWELADRAGLATVEIDTDWPRANNVAGIGSPAGFESVCERLDVVLTTRLHGMVLALKRGVPAVVLDAVKGGDKVTRQACAIRWPEVFDSWTASDEELDAALSRCLSDGARARARECADAARAFHATFADRLGEALAAPAHGRFSDTRPPPTPPRSELRRRLRLRTRTRAALAWLDALLAGPES